MGQNVTSLVVSERLKSYGFPQGKTVYSWRWSADGGPESELGTLYHEDNEYACCASAPTAEEIASLMPVEIEGGEQPLIVAKAAEGGYWATYMTELVDHPTAYGETMAEALALLWLKLQEARI